jgi:hypothetical protein
MLLHADLDLKHDQADREEHDPLADPAEQRGAEHHPEQPGVDRMTCHCIRPVSAEPVIIFDLGRHAPHGAERKPGPQREHGRGDQHDEPEDPDPRGPDGQAVKVATAGNRQAQTHHRHDDQPAITCRQAGLAPGPLTRSMRGVAPSMEGVIQRTGHPHDHDRADAHGNASLCEHVGHLRVGRRWGTSSRRQRSNHHSSNMTAGLPAAAGPGRLFGPLIPVRPRQTDAAGYPWTMRST